MTFSLFDFVREGVEIFLFNKIIFLHWIKCKSLKAKSFFRKSKIHITDKILFNNFIFFLRDNDFNALKEVFKDKDYFLVKEFVPPKNSIILDLGSGIGDYALLTSRIIGKEGKVISIEGGKECFELLKKNIKLNRQHNILPIKARIGNKITIDKIIEKIDLKELELIKIDIEGAEYNALKGAINTLKKFKPKVVVEIHSPLLRKRIIKFLQKFNYYLFFEKEKKRFNFYLSYFLTTTK
jgi:23S rRNA U2552 (ribose-2'-O)-methylase RlmE/FtsJ